jgi:Tol biopolymer transport system component
MDGQEIDDWSRLRHQSQWPEWSPDRTQILYQLNQKDTYVIRVMNADGSNDREVAVDAWSAHWSGDGRRIVYVSHDARGLTGLYQLDVETGSSAALTSNPGNGVCFH